jgi:hypothetical protein
MIDPFCDSLLQFGNVVEDAAAYLLASDLGEEALNQIEPYAAAQKPEGQITEVSYMFAKPGADTKPVPKVSFVTRAGDLGCGVGYYK